MQFGQIERNYLEGDLWSLYQTTFSLPEPGRHEAKQIQPSDRHKSANAEPTMSVAVDSWKIYETTSTD